MKERIRWIDVAKGISILLIIIGHVNSGSLGKINLHLVYAVNVTMFF